MLCGGGVAFLVFRVMGRQIRRHNPSVDATVQASRALLSRWLMLLPVVLYQLVSGLSGRVSLRSASPRRAAAGRRSAKLMEEAADWQKLSVRLGVWAMAWQILPAFSYLRTAL